MIYIEKYNRYIAEAKRKIGDLQIKAAELSNSGFNATSEVELSTELQDSLDFMLSDYNMSSEEELLRIMDYYTTKASLVIFSVIL